MNIKTKFLLVALCSFYTSAYSNHYTPTQKTILLLKSILNPLWHSTASPAPSKTLTTQMPTTEALPGAAAHTTLFFSRTPEVDTLAKHVDAGALEESAFQGFIPFLESATIQEHTLGVHYGQRLVQDNWELLVNAFIGTRERNLWLNQPLRDDLSANASRYANTFTRSATAQDPHAPRQLEPRLTHWHATGTTSGLSDINLLMRYRLPLFKRLGISLGLATNIPVGAHASHTTTPDSDASMPLALDEYLVHLVNRSREMLLCAPLGSNGHFGFGPQVMADLVISPALSFKASASRMTFRSGIEDRYALDPSSYLPHIEEGVPYTQEEMSTRDNIMPHLLQRIHPSLQKVSIQPGTQTTASALLAYFKAPLLWSLNYTYAHTGRETSETAPLATLRAEEEPTHTVSSTLGTRKRREWGQFTSFLTGHLTFAGALQSWGIGWGISVQS
jgi:hypothetical protein